MDIDFFWQSKKDPRFNGSDSDPNKIGARQVAQGRSTGLLPADAEDWLARKSKELGVPIPDDLEWQVSRDGIPVGGWRKYGG